MLKLFQTQYLVTNKNDPMGVDGGLYLIVSMAVPHRYVRVNIGPTDMPAEFSNFEDVFGTFGMSLWAQTGSHQTKLFLGGTSDKDELSFFHDSQCDLTNTLKIGDRGLISYSPLVDFINASDETRMPSMWKFVFGHQEIEDSEIDSRLQSKEWRIVTAPAYITYGEKAEALIDVVHEELEPPTRNWGGWFGKILSAKQLISGFKGAATEMQLNAIRTGLSLYYYSKNEQPFDHEYLEKVIDVQIATYKNQGDEIVDVFDKISREELDQKHRSLRKRTMKFPLSKENRRMREISERIGLNRYAYDYAIMKLTQKRNETEEIDNASTRNLEREINVVEDIVKDSDQGRSWD